MRLLLQKDVRKLGHVGDIVEVKAGYGRNCLLPQRLAVEPTDENIKAIGEEKKRAAAERARRLNEYRLLAEAVQDVSVTIEAAANPEGTLYGSVGAREIAEGLQALGHPVLPEQVALESPIRTLDNRLVTVEFTDEISAQVRLWVVREGGVEHADEAGAGVTDSQFEAEPDSGNETDEGE